MEKPNVGTVTVKDTDWFVCDGRDAWNIPQATVNSDFTVEPILTWTAMLKPPSASLNADGTVTLAFAQPLSPTGAFSYTATGPGTIGQFSTAANGLVTATVSGLSGQTAGPWTVSVTAAYGLTGTSLPSNTVSLVKWAATATPPTATVNNDGSVSLSFPQPTVPTGSFTYAVTGPGTVGQSSTDAQGLVTVPITGLSGSAVGPWTVAVTTPTGGTATSVASNTVDIIAWSALQTAPVATAEAGLTASIIFSQPAFPSTGTWVYTVEQTDMTSHPVVTSPATLQGSPVIANGQVTLTVSGLANLRQFTFAVTATDGVSATSLPTNEIQATT
jgi:hypothetical protein